MNIEVGCPICSQDVDLGVDTIELDDDCPEDREAICCRCGATVSATVRMTIDVSCPNVISGPTQGRWMLAAAYYEGKHLYRSVKPWSPPYRGMPPECALGEVKWRIEWDGGTFASDGFFAFRLGPDTDLQEIEDVDELKEARNFFDTLKTSPYQNEVRPIARVIGGGLHDGRVEDYAVVIGAYKSLVYFRASYIDTMQHIYPDLICSLAKKDELLVFRSGDDIVGVCAGLLISEPDLDMGILALLPTFRSARQS